MSIDPDHHVTEAIGDMYGEYIDEEGRRQSYILPSDAYPNSSRGAKNRNSSVFSATGASGSGRDRSSGGSQGNELLPGSPALAHRSPSPSRSPSETANQFFPLHDTDYESDPAAVAQEISNLQALRRMSMDVTSTADPDLPSFNSFIPSTPPEDGGDPGSVFWVPARLHPELAPKEFSAYLEAKKNEIRRPQRDGSLSPDGAEVSGGPGLRRKKSMLSKQIDHSDGAKGYRDGTEALGRRRSGKEGPPQLQLEDLMNDPNTLMRKLSVERRNGEGRIAMDLWILGPDSNGYLGDMPILQAHPAGAGLRRSTRTTYRRGSLRKGEPFMKRQAKASETDTEEYTASSPIVGRPSGFGLQRVSTEPIPSIPSHFSTKSQPEGQSSKPTRSANKKVPATEPSASSIDLSNVSTPTQPKPSGDSKHKSAPPPQKQRRRASSPKGTTRPRTSEPAPPVPRIVETPPPSEEPKKMVHPERHSSLDPPSQTNKPPKQTRPAMVRTPGGSAADLSNESTQAPSTPAPAPAPAPASAPATPQPGNLTKASQLMMVPGANTADDSKDKRRPDSSGSGESSTRKSSWGWLLGDSEHKAKDKHDREKEERREKEEKDKDKEKRVRKEKRPKSSDKSTEKSTKDHDNTRLDLLQKSIDLGNTGKVITADPVGTKTDEKADKESRKSRGEEKKDKDKESGGILSFFGSSRKKSGGDTSKSKNGSSRNPSPSPSREQPQQNFYYTRFPIHIERAIYRLSHLKLANPRRPLQQQVLLSNFMYSYLAKVQQTQPHLVQQATTAPSREARHREKQAQALAQEQQNQQQQNQQQQQQQQQQSHQQTDPQGNQYYQYEDVSL